MKFHKQFIFIFLLFHIFSASYARVSNPDCEICDQGQPPVDQQFMDLKVVNDAIKEEAQYPGGGGGEPEPEKSEDEKAEELLRQAQQEMQNRISGASGVAGNAAGVTGSGLNSATSAINPMSCNSAQAAGHSTVGAVQSAGTASGGWGTTSTTSFAPTSSGTSLTGGNVASWGGATTTPSAVQAPASSLSSGMSAGTPTVSGFNPASLLPIVSGVLNSNQQGNRPSNISSNGANWTSSPAVVGGTTTRPYVNPNNQTTSPYIASRDNDDNSNNGDSGGSGSPNGFNNSSESSSNSNLTANPGSTTVASDNSSSTLDNNHNSTPSWTSSSELASGTVVPSYRQTTTLSSLNGDRGSGRNGGGRGGSSGSAGTNSSNRTSSSNFSSMTASSAGWHNTQPNTSQNSPSLISKGSVTWRVVPERDMIIQSPDGTDFKITVIGAESTPVNVISAKPIMITDGNHPPVLADSSRSIRASGKGGAPIILSSQGNNVIRIRNLSTAHEPVTVAMEAMNSSKSVVAIYDIKSKEQPFVSVGIGSSEKAFGKNAEKRKIDSSKPMSLETKLKLAGGAALMAGFGIIVLFWLKRKGVINKTLEGIRRTGFRAHYAKAYASEPHRTV